MNWMYNLTVSPLLGNFIAGDIGKKTDLAFSLEDLIFAPLHRMGYIISRTNENCK